MSRYRAFGIHLGISFVIFLILAYFVVFEWYPGFFFDTDGGWRGMRIIVAVDMVLGPALTLVVYRAGKPGLKMDLTLIGLFQFVCLFAGTYVVWSERPIAVVYNDGRFTAMTVDDYTGAELEPPNLTHFPGDAPKWVTVKLPQGDDEEAAFRREFFSKGAVIATAVDHYTPFEFAPAEPEALDLEIIRAKDGGEAALEAWTNEHGSSIDDYAFFTLSTRYTYAYMGFRRHSGELLGLLTIEAY